MGLLRTIAVGGLGIFCAAVPARAGLLEGTVHLEGQQPELVNIPIESKSPEHPVDSCGGPTKTSDRLRVSETGGLANAVVWLEINPTKGRETAGEVLPPTTAQLDQRTCDFVPHLLLVPRGSTVMVRNSDPILHNLRLFRDATMLSHEWQKPQAEEVKWHFDEPGRFLVRCGVHSWMFAWVVVADHRYYALSNPDGTFTMSDVPPGEYTLRAWHEMLGEQAQRIVVDEHGAKITVHYETMAQIIAVQRH